MSAGHTAGPWVEHCDSDWSVDTESSNSFSFIGPKGARPVAIAVVAGPDAFEYGKLDANARLIAAAPDLLAALLPLVNCMPVGGGMVRFDGDELAAARAAIAKATGEEKK